MPKLHDLAGNHVIHIHLPVRTILAADSVGFVRVPFDCTVTAADLTPGAAVTADATHYASISIRNGGATGTGTTEITSRSWAATNSVAKTKESLTLSATAANLVLAEGDILVITAATAGNGLVTPSCGVNLTVQAT